MPATLSSPLILTDIIGAFKKRVPMLFAMSTNFTAEPVRLGQTVTAHIRQLPTTGTYNPANGGYANGATEGKELLVDVSVVVDKHEHVTISLAHLNLISDQKDVYEGAIEDAAYVLGKSVVDSVLRKFTTANVSYSRTATPANSDYDVLTAIRADMNKNGAANIGRVGIVNSDVFQTLDTDPRIASKDYLGQETEGEAYGHLRRVAGFKDIWEYPDLGENSSAGATFTAAVTDVITSNGHGYKNGDVVRFTTDNALPAGLVAGTTYHVRDVTVNTFKVSLTDGGAAVDITTTGTGVHTVGGFENLTGIFFEPRAIALRTGLPDHTFDVAADLGIPKIASAETVTDPDSGLSLMAIKWMQPGTFDLKLTVVLLWGSAVGRQGGAAGAITDKAAERLVAA